MKEEGDRAKNDGREALGTRIVLAGAFGQLVAARFVTVAAIYSAPGVVDLYE